MKRLHLDTNALIALSDPDLPVFSKIEQQIINNYTAQTCAVAWHEYVRGPLTTEDHNRALLILENNIIPVHQETAELAAKLFNQTGRRRASTADCLIAATAILTKAQMATMNISDFEVFIPFGLKLLQ